MSFSTIPAVKAAITDALIAALPSLQVTYGAPGLEGLKREAVWVAGLANWATDWAALGPLGLTSETYVLELNVVAGNPEATSFQTTTERVFAIADQVDTVVRGLLAINGIVLAGRLLLTPAPGGFSEFFSTDKGTGRVSLLQLGVHVSARPVG